jgi:hypothetical protein
MERLTRVVLAVATIVLLAGGTGWAASIAVNTFEPAVAADGLCSLVEAMENANADAGIHRDCVAGDGPDAIELMVGEYVVREVHNEVYGPSGLPAVTGDLTINGHTSRIERARNGPLFRLFQVTERARLTLNNLTIENGAVEGWRGGGLFNAGGTAVLNHCTVRGNAANDGGGLANQNGVMLLTWTVVDANRSARDGGGIDNWAATGDAALVVMASTVSSNTAAHDGGGLVNAASAGRTASLQLVGSAVIANRAERSGGGVSQFGLGASQMEPKGGVVTRPRWSNAQMELRIVNHSRIADNIAGERGGGIASWVSPPGAWSAQVEMSLSDIAGNQALEGDGGGVYGWFAGSSVAVNRSTIDGNEARNGRGGGLAIGEGAVLDLARSTVSRNIADGLEYPAGVGGGIEIIAAEATIMDCTISGNQALRGAGIDVATLATDNRKLEGGAELGSSVEVADCTIADNTALGLGGGIAVVAVPGFGPAELRMVGTILGYNADRRGSGNCSSAAPAVLLSDGHNVADDSTCWLMSAPDGGVGGPLADEDLMVPDLMLEELADNGGPSLTHMPLDGSPVIDVGAGGGQRCHGDQRDFPRDVDMGEMTVGCKCDAGAIEAGSAAMPMAGPRDPSGSGSRDN